MSGFNYLSAEALRDPYPALAELRRTAPVYWDELHRMWWVTGYEDAVRVLRDTEVFSSARTHPMLAGKAPSTHKPRIPILLFSDPPEHTALRRLLSKSFTPRRVTELAPKIEQIVEGLLPAEGPFEVVSGLSAPLPVAVMAELFAVPVEDRAHLLQWSADEGVAMGRQLIPHGPLVEPKTVKLRALTGSGFASPSNQYFRKLVSARREQRGADLVSNLISAVEGKEGSLNNEQVVAFCSIVISRNQCDFWVVEQLGDGQK